MASRKPQTKPAQPADGIEPGAGMTYEQMVERVEEITAKIESGDVGLEESILMYEEGVRLSRRCQDLLLNAQQRVEELNKQLLSGRPESDRGRPLDGADDPSDEEGEVPF